MLEFLAKANIQPFVWLYGKMHTRKIILPPSSPPLLPTFVAANELADGEYFYNPDFYATEQTAMDVMARFNALVAFKKAVQDGDKLAPPQWFIRFSDGLEINAGQLAKFFASYREEEYPGIAARFGISLIAYEREKKEMMGRQNEMVE